MVIKALDSFFFTAHQRLPAAVDAVIGDAEVIADALGVRCTRS